MGFNSHLKAEIRKADNAGCKECDVVVRQTLVWYEEKDAHGTFNVAKDDSYTVEVDLVGNVDGAKKNPLFDGDWTWDGKTLTKKGEGRLILKGNNTYDGGTHIEEGILQGNIPEDKTLKISSDATYDGAAEARIVSRLEGDSGSLIQNTAGLIVRSGNFSGVIDETNGALIKEGGEELILGGNNTYTGPTVVRGGTLTLDGGGSISSQSLILYGDTRFASADATPVALKQLDVYGNVHENVTYNFDKPASIDKLDIRSNTATFRIPAAMPADIAGSILLDVSGLANIDGAKIGLDIAPGGQHCFRRVWRDPASDAGQSVVDRVRGKERRW